MAPPKFRQALTEGRGEGMLAQFTPGVVGRNDKADPILQFRQVKALARQMEWLRQTTRSAIRFFQSIPNIPQIAETVSKIVDVSIKAANRWSFRDPHSPVPPGRFPLADEISNNILANRSRSRIDNFTELMLKEYHTPQHVKYRIPRPLAVALQMSSLPYGRCEEHALLALYFLTIGHMTQGMPFGRLKNDIYYTGFATEPHAMAILVKGAEFKDAVIAAKKGYGKNDYKWLGRHPHQWGKSAWIVDGWDTENVTQLANSTLDIDYDKTQTFRRDVVSGQVSEWDLNVQQMALRVAKDYRIL